jgi:hypothetical protein
VDTGFAKENAIKQRARAFSAKVGTGFAGKMREFKRLKRPG